MVKTSVTPEMGAVYDYKVIEVRDQYMTVQRKGEDRPGAEIACDELGAHGWLLTAVSHVGADTNYLFFVRRVK